MKLGPLDVAVIVAFFVLNLGIGLYYSRRGGTSLSEYFLSGRNVPWWLAGTSMVATTFGADTPLAVSEMVTKNGIAGNWLWWNMVMSGILTVFFFAALWRRSGVLTDVEFIELRYSGKPAAALRGVRAVYQGLLVNTIIMGWVNLAIAKILGLVLGIPKFEAIGICLAFTALYVMIGGLWSVLVTDLVQFVVKMTMTVVLAVVAVAAVGGIGALRSKLALVDSAHATGGSVLAFFPTTDAAWMPIATFLTYVGVSWWASSYPGAEPGGGGYIAQRIFSSKDERNSIFATLFFNVAHYALRPWPWILVALCALVFYPHGVKDASGTVDPALGYVQTMIDYLPASLRGLMMAGFLAAYMSTIGTHLNLGASYMVNDLYRRFIRREASETHYVWISRAMTIVAMLLAALVTVFMDSISGAWQFLLTFSAGVGLVMILRWYWWRVNAWSEISALCTSAAVATLIKIANVFPESDPNAVAKSLLVTVAATTVVWLAVTVATGPEPEAVLVRFFERVRPDALGWGPIAARASVAGEQERLGLRILAWIAGCGLVYGMLFGIGKIVLGEVASGVAFVVFACACLALILRDMNRRPGESSGMHPAAALVVAALLLLPSAARAAEDKLLQNVHGDVSYVISGTTEKLAPSATKALNDKDVAQTGNDSLGALTLPDSSRVSMGSNTRVQLAFFSQTDVATAQFVVYQGKTRFNIEHPKGAKADYKFVTPTATIAVRGTEGDISVDGDTLRVNVYHLTDDKLPVQVTFSNGKTVTLLGGQTLLAQVVNGIIQTQVDRLTDAVIGQFGEFGVPTTVDQLRQNVINEVRRRLPF
jgi:solute:Na+ symporter, SSS family